MSCNIQTPTDEKEQKSTDMRRNKLFVVRIESVSRDVNCRCQEVDRHCAATSYESSPSLTIGHHLNWVLSVPGVGSIINGQVECLIWFHSRGFHVSPSRCWIICNSFRGPEWSSRYTLVVFVGVVRRLRNISNIFPPDCQLAFNFVSSISLNILVVN